MRMVKAVDSKNCTKCNEIKYLNLFVKMARHKTGYSPWCKLCHKTYRDNNKEYHSKRYKEWLANNLEHKKAYNKDWQTKNLEHSRSYRQQYWFGKEDIKKKYRQTDYRKNKSRFIANVAKRRAEKLNATPNWLTKSHLKEISAFYNKAKEISRQTGVTYHVDHIEPLKGKEVCGLHVPWNLQVITAKENLLKNNKRK